MNRDPSDRLERELSERFRETLQSHSLPEYDSSALRLGMVKEMRRRPLYSRASFHLNRIPTRIFAVLCVTALVVTLLVGYTAIHTPGSSAVQSVGFWGGFFGNTSDIPRPWQLTLWKLRLKKGRYVTVPPLYAPARITLSDGSNLTCQPGTELAVRFDEGRNIHLRSGTIDIDAAEVRDSTMTVKTPYWDVSVVGTKFRVELEMD